jgi:addiction module RelB/DinJ family antitoxin
MRTTVINVKTERDVKKNAQKVAEELGLSLSTIINAYLKQFVRNKEVHFTTAPRMSVGLEEFLGRAQEDIKKKRNLSPVFSSGEEMDRWLNSP